MADKEHEAHVAAAAPPADAEVDEHGLTVLKVSEGDMPAPDPRHAGPEKLGREARFDPNAAMRAKMGYGPGLQDSEIVNPAVWVDSDSDDARKAAADAHVADAQRALDRAKEDAKALKKGEPLMREIP
jgi:hypothetical protein